jgi:STE24 endopeptidase
VLLSNRPQLCLYRLTFV